MGQPRINQKQQPHRWKSMNHHPMTRALMVEQKQLEAQLLHQCTSTRAKTEKAQSL